MIPSVKITKTDGNTGVVRPSEDGVLAIIAPAAGGTANVPAAYTRAANALSDFEGGILPECAAYVLNEAGNPVLLIAPTCSTAASYGSITTSGAGTSEITAGETAPWDDYPNVEIVFTAGGTIGAAGIEYTYTLDGVSVSAVQALGTANSITIPNSGVSVGLGSGTILANETASFTTTGPRMTNSDLTSALAALRATKQPWEAVLIFGEADSTMVSTVDEWLTGLTQIGQYRTAILSARLKAANESEATYEAAMATAFSASSSINLLVCADGGTLPQVLSGLVLPRPTALAVAARGMAIDIATDPAYVALGPVGGFDIDDARGNSLYHDEQLNPGLDDLRLTALRSVPGYDGPYINNANLLSPPGSDYVYWQQARVINRACEVAYQLLTNQLSIGVLINSSDNILETAAQQLEGMVQAALDREFVKVSPPRVSQIAFTLARDDDLSSNGPGELTAYLQVNAIRYVKTFNVTAGFVKTITTPAAA